MTRQDLRNILLEEHSKANSQRVTQLIEHQSIKLKDLLILFKSSEKIVAQRAASAVNDYFDNHRDQIELYIEEITSQWDNAIHSSLNRTTMRLLQFVDLPSDQEGRVLDKSFEFLLNPTVNVAIRVFSMQVITNLVIKHPELKSEFEDALGLLESPTNAMKARIRHIKKQLSKID